MNNVNNAAVTRKDAYTQRLDQRKLVPWQTAEAVGWSDSEIKTLLVGTLDAK